MSSSFRSEIFKLGKKIRQNEIAQSIAEQVRSLTVPVQEQKNNTNVFSGGGFAQVATHFNNEFHGYLFLDDNLETMNIPTVYRVCHLAKAERELIENAHKTLARFADLCLSELSARSRKIGELLNPYSLYKELKLSPNTEPIIADEEMADAVNSYKQGKLYQAFVGINFAAVFDRIELGVLKELIGRLENEISQSMGEYLTGDIKEFSQRFFSKRLEMTDFMFEYSVVMYALKSSLQLACRELYRSMCGADLFVLNNDNVISIEKQISTDLCDYYKVFSQDMAWEYRGDEMRSMILLDCDTERNTHIHEFGMITSLTLNLLGEFGSSAKYSFVTVNDEMICIHRLTDAFLKRGLPQVNDFK